MARVPPLKVEGLSDLQLKVASQLGETRGNGGPRVSGPWGALLYSPELCEKAAALGNLLRDGTSLPTRLSELAIAITARHWGAQWEWRSHAPKGLKAGLSAEVLDAIRLRRPPPFERADEAAVFGFLSELLANHRARDPTYEALVKEVGVKGAIELTAVAGFYGLVAMLINGLDIALPAGVERPMPD